CFAAQIPGDIADFAVQFPERVTSLVLCVPTRVDPRPFVHVAPRLLLIAGEVGLSAETTRRALAQLPGAQEHILPGYNAQGWSDVIADRTSEVVGAMISFLRRSCSGPPMANPRATSGTHAGLDYRIVGQGPPLVLLPFLLAPSQWDPALAELGQHFTVIQLGGRHIGGVAVLEDRARAPTYRAMFRHLMDVLAPPADGRILDVGCGSGALDRILAARLGTAARIDAIDVNPFLLREAVELAREFGDRIGFTPGSALNLPFPEETFDCVFSVTVLEECDANRAIAEMLRVARPGARIGIVVRAIDLAQWWNLELPAAISAIANVPPQSVGPGGVADASLYVRMRQAGMVDLCAFPTLITLDQPEGPIWRYREDDVRSRLSPEDAIAWSDARAKAARHGVLVQAHALHCAVGTKPI
ncbi:MAG TPA: methyltransferase domain-containing protein, partial [Hyphomicrobiaceae bacterium]|nr:methyltransferase domain-containing protein [Hyphomicrobiaceae bacterium]